MTMDVPLTVELLAQAFCAMNDEQQAQFFIDCAKIACEWHHHASQQWYLVGRHLRTCACSTPEAREMLEQIVAGMQR
jgi:hypothetical protein